MKRGVLSIISGIVRELNGPLTELFVNLDGDDGDEWWKQLRRLLRKEPCWVPLLTPVATVTVSRPEVFVVREHFKDRFSKKGVVIVFNDLHEGQNPHFGFREERWTESSHVTLWYQTLNDGSEDGPIIQALGGEDKAETSFAEIWSLLRLQLHGQAGALLNSGIANIFYVKDVNGVMRSVAVDWRDGLWSVSPHPIGDVIYNHRSRVFSRIF